VSPRRGLFLSFSTQLHTFQKWRGSFDGGGKVLPHQREERHVQLEPEIGVFGPDALRQPHAVLDRAVEEFVIDVHVERFEQCGDMMRLQLGAELVAEAVERREILRGRVVKRRRTGAEDEALGADGNGLGRTRKTTIGISFWILSFDY